nr:MAG TPA: hypothetical protein [Caudoviricetes sp.]
MVNPFGKSYFFVGIFNIPFHCLICEISEDWCQKVIRIYIFFHTFWKAVKRDFLYKNLYKKVWFSLVKLGDYKTCFRV